MWSPFLTLRDLLADLDDRARALVAENGAGHDADVAVLEREVGVADAARAELDDHVTRSGRSGLEVLDDEWPTGFDEDCGPHEALPFAESLRLQSYRETPRADVRARPEDATAAPRRVSPTIRRCSAWRTSVRPAPSPRRRCLPRPTSPRASAPRMRSVPDVIAAVERGDVDGGVVPIENMIEGSVSVTLDTLAFDSELLDPARDRPAGVAATCARRPGVGARRRAHGRVVPARRSRQCRGWLAKQAARRRAARRRTPPPTRRARSRSRSGRDLAAICNALAAELYGLEVLAHRDRGPPGEPDPVRARRARRSPRRPVTTRRRSCASSARTARARCSRSSRSSRRVRSTSPSSSRARRSAASATTASSSTVEGHIADELVADALRNLAAKQAEVKFLGSYPVGGPIEAGAERRRAAAARVEARGDVGRRAARADPRRTTDVIDLKRLREEPEYRARHRAQARARRTDRRSARGRRGAPRAACTEVERCGARQNAASKEIGKAAPDERAGEDRGRGRAQGGAAPREEQVLARARRAACASSRCRCRTRPTRRCPTAARTTAR